MIDSQGMVQRGDQFLITGGGGSLRIEHGVGMVMAWVLDPPGAPGAGLFAETPKGESNVSIPSAVPLTGAARALRFQHDCPLLLHVRVDAPMLARWEWDGAPPAEVLLRDEGGTFDLYLPKGRGLLALRPIGGGSLSAPPRSPRARSIR